MNNLVIALEISALGMCLVFAALILLWGLMSLLTAFTTDKKTSPPQSISASGSTGRSPAMEETLRAQAVAVAVAMAIAEQQVSSAQPLPAPPTANVSAWQLGMRTRQMYQKGGSTRRRARQEIR